MAEYHEYTDQYKVPVIAKLLHALPHYNITFHKINSTFRPNDEIYLEVSTVFRIENLKFIFISLFYDFSEFGYFGFCAGCHINCLTAGFAAILNDKML